MTNLTLDDVHQALTLSDFDVMAAWMRMVPSYRLMQRPHNLKGRAKLAGVLILLYPLDGVLTFVLTRRTETVATHKGQVSLPGGAQEPGETLYQTAIRETCEELLISLHKDEIELLGALSPLYVSVSDFEIHPLELSLPMLLDDSTKTKEHWNIQGLAADIPFYRVAGHAVWGATAVMLSEFEGRLRAVINSPG